MYSMQSNSLTIMTNHDEPTYVSRNSHLKAHARKQNICVKLSSIAQLLLQPSVSAQTLTTKTIVCH